MKLSHHYSSNIIITFDSFEIIQSFYPSSNKVFLLFHDYDCHDKSEILFQQNRIDLRLLKNYHILHIFLIKIQSFPFNNLCEEFMNKNDIILAKQLLKVHFQCLQMLLIRKDIQVVVRYWWLRRVRTYGIIVSVRRNDVFTDWLVARRYWRFIRIVRKLFIMWFDHLVIIIQNRLQVTVILPNYLFLHFLRHFQ